jgi:hypothetical protein
MIYRHNVGFVKLVPVESSRFLRFNCSVYLFFLSMKSALKQDLEVSNACNRAGHKSSLKMPLFIYLNRLLAITL